MQFLRFYYRDARSPFYKVYDYFALCLGKERRCLVETKFVVLA